MKYKNIKIGNKNNYTFVRGTSVNQALEFILDAVTAINKPSMLQETIFFAYAHPKFPRNKDYSSAFSAKDISHNILPAECFAARRAFNDYLATAFDDIINPDKYFGKKDFFEKFGTNSGAFFDEYSSELKMAGFTNKDVETEFRLAQMHKGVLIYFNESLTGNLICPDSNYNHHRRFNSVQIFSERPISRDAIMSIQPLGNLDLSELKSGLSILKSCYS